MGFLDHSTNNIIVDAVLTDAGRQALAKNDGSFQIYQFALGDDEIDYQLIQQYGRTVGKEKIEKNTPIMEALTAGSLALKNKLISADNEFIVNFPLLTTTVSSGGNFSFTRPTATGVGESSKVINVRVALADSTGTVDAQIEDSAFRVELNSLFFEIADRGSPDITYADNTVVYEIDEFGSEQGDGISTTSFTLRVKNFSDSTFQVYKTAGGNSIKTYLKVTGINSGLSKSTVLTNN